VSFSYITPANSLRYETVPRCRASLISASSLAGISGRIVKFPYDANPSFGFLIPPAERYSSRTSCPFLHDGPVEFFCVTVLPCPVAHKIESKFTLAPNAAEIPSSAPRRFAANYPALASHHSSPITSFLIYGTGIRNPRKALKT
jgi:hypothetical protein